MKQRAHFQQLGATGARTLRMGVAADEVRKAEDPTAPAAVQCVLGDSWFASVKPAVALFKKGKYFSGIVKTAHALYPKDWIMKKMSGKSRGTWCVLHTQIDGCPLVAVGYRYNSKKTICFLSTRGATAPGKPYQAKFLDGNNNLTLKAVARAAMISDYFERANTIDTLNQLRQGVLALGKKWLTHDAFFRVITSVYGVIIVTDTYRAYQYGNRSRGSLKYGSLLDFVDTLMADMLAAADKESVAHEVPEMKESEVPHPKLTYPVETKIATKDSGPQGGRRRGHARPAQSAALACAAVRAGHQRHSSSPQWCSRGSAAAEACGERRRPPVWAPSARSGRC